MKKQTGIAPKRKNGKAVQVEAPKPKQRSFKNKVIDPAMMKKVRVDSKTELIVHKDRDTEDVKRKYYANQARANSQYLKG